MLVFENFIFENLLCGFSGAIFLEDLLRGNSLEGGPSVISLQQGSCIE